MLSSKPDLASGMEDAQNVHETHDQYINFVAAAARLCMTLRYDKWAKARMHVPRWPAFVGRPCVHHTASALYARASDYATTTD